MFIATANPTSNAYFMSKIKQELVTGMQTYTEEIRAANEKASPNAIRVAAIDKAFNNLPKDSQEFLRTRSNRISSNISEAMNRLNIQVNKTISGLHPGFPKNLLLGKWQEWNKDVARAFFIETINETFLNGIDDDRKIDEHITKKYTEISTDILRKLSSSPTRSPIGPEIFRRHLVFREKYKNDFPKGMSTRDNKSLSDNPVKQKAQQLQDMSKHMGLMN